MKAFTLVELLVIVGVVAVLAALLVPVAMSGTARAQSARCVGNLRSLGGALQLYLADNNMMMPPLVASRASRDEQVPAIDNTLDRYVDDARVFACPPDREFAAASGTSYYWNSVISGQAVAGLNFLSLTSDLTKIPVLLDKEGWHPGGKVNHLFADGHAGPTLQLSTSP